MTVYVHFAYATLYSDSVLNLYLELSYSRMVGNSYYGLIATL